MLIMILFNVFFFSFCFYFHVQGLFWFETVLYHTIIILKNIISKSIFWYKAVQSIAIIGEYVHVSHQP